MSGARVLLGDVREHMAEIPDHSIDLILTSWPYWELRDYLGADHQEKAKEIGHEDTPADFINVLLEVTAEFRRVLTKYGSVCLELGDTLVNKERQMIPESYRWALGKGWSPFLGPSVKSPAGKWKIRQVHYHCRPNPPVSALGDKFRPSVSEWVIACTSAKRWFDLVAVRVPFSENTHQADSVMTDGAAARHAAGGIPRFGPQINTHAGAPPLDHSWLDWDDWFPAAQRTPTTPYPGAHYATFGPAVIRPFIEAMCPMQVCTECGEPRRRIVGEATYTDADGADRTDDAASWQSAGANGNRGPNNGRTDGGIIRQAPTLGWTDCGHGPDNWRNGIVLDPFVGSGTTLEVATGCGRDAIGIDLDERNLDLIRQRVGLFLEEIA